VPVGNISREWISDISSFHLTTVAIPYMATCHRLGLGEVPGSAIVAWGEKQKHEVLMESLYISYIDIDVHIYIYIHILICIYIYILLI